MGKNRYFEGFQTVYEENYLKMYYVASELLKQQADAELAVYEAFLMLAEHFNKYSHFTDSKMTEFCICIVRNKAIHIFCRSNRCSKEEQEELMQRETLILKYYYGMESREIAKVQGVSKMVVKMRLYRGKQKLKVILNEEAVE